MVFLLHHIPDLVRIILHASNVTARILSIAVLILSLAPLGSMYVVFFSISGGGGGVYQQQADEVVDRSANPAYWEDGHCDPALTSCDNLHPQEPQHQYETLLSLAELLRSPNVTLDELWTAFFAVSNGGPPLPLAAVIAAALQNNRHHHAGGSLYHQHHHDPSSDGGVWFTVPPSTAQFYYYHWRLLMPWVVSLVLGVFVPCVLSAVTLARRRRIYLEHHRPPQLTAAQERSLLQRLADGLQPYSMSLTEADKEGHWVSEENEDCDENIEWSDSRMEENDDYENDDDKDDGEVCKWWIPAPGVPMLDDFLSSCRESCAECPAPSPARQRRRRLVTGSCGICLDNFVMKSSVVPTSDDDDPPFRHLVSWSSNPNCVHCFHTACIHAWLLRTYKIRRQPSDSRRPCPCCRQTFMKRLPKTASPIMSDDTSF